MRSFSCHPDPEPFAFCHSEGAERPKNLTQGKLREGEGSLDTVLSRSPEQSEGTCEGLFAEPVLSTMRFFASLRMTGRIAKQTHHDC